MVVWRGIAEFVTISVSGGRGIAEFVTISVSGGGGGYSRVCNN